MKTAEEWSKEYNSTYKALNEEADRVVGDSVVPSEDIHEIIIKQIQLDAMKEGMRRAADDIFYNHPITISRIGMKDAYDIQQAILTTAEQLTEKDL